MAAEYTGVIAPTKPVLGVAALEPLLTQIAAWTNPWHYFVYGRSTGFESFISVNCCFKAAFWVHAIVDYAVITAGILLLLFEVFRSSGTRKTQSATLVSSTIPVVLTSVYYSMGFTVSFNPTPFGYIVSLSLVAWALFGAQFLDIVPVGRAQMVNSMNDPAVVIDNEGRVVECNPAAREFVDVAPDCTGMPAEAFFSEFPEEVRQFRSTESVNSELTVQKDGSEYHFYVDVSPIYDPTGELAGRTFLFRDVTELKNREQELRKRERELDVLRQVQSRVLRHNIRTELSMVRGHADIVAAEVSEDHRERMEAILEAGNRLTTISNKARVVEELFEGDHSPREYDLRGCIEQAVTQIRTEYPDLSISISGAEECHAMASPHLQTAVENLLENAALHNTSEQPEVAVHLTNGSQKRLTISDNGPGIPEQELTVLDKGSEGALEHGSGLGLWLVKWIADRSNADLTFETGDHGTDVVLTFG
jgi:PAS domain S-box-containing protein